MSKRAIIVSSECMDRIACETYLSLFISGGSHILAQTNVLIGNRPTSANAALGSECDAKPETCQFVVCVSCFPCYDTSCSPCYDISSGITRSITRLDSRKCQNVFVYLEAF